MTLIECKNIDKIMACALHRCAACRRVCRYLRVRRVPPGCLTRRPGCPQEARGPKAVKEKQEKAEREWKKRIK